MNILINLVEGSYIIIFGLVCILLCKYIMVIAKKYDINQKVVYRFISFILIWYLFSLGISIKGFYQDPQKFSKGDYIGLLGLLAMMFIPLAIFFYLLKNKILQKLIEIINLKFITNLLSYRVIGGIYWFLLLFDKRAPALFAIPPGIFDAMIGITAPLIASGKVKSVKIVKIWNYLGIFDFLLAFSVYFLYFPFRILRVPPEKIMWGGFYPVAFIVMFVVPLSIILHVIALIKISKKSS